jgi:uncharacterized protein
MGFYETILFGIVIFITHLLEGITGFGCTVLALPFCIALAGMTTAIPVLVVLGMLLCLYVVCVDFKNIVWKEYFKIISFVVLGLPIGIWIFSNLPEDLLKKLLGVFMIVVSLRGLYISYFAALKTVPSSMTGIKKYLLNFLLFLGGIVHGAFSSGGPFVVIYASQALPDKSHFRATLCTLWVSLNLMLTINNFRTGVMTEQVLQVLLYSLPFLAGGMVFGNMAHKRIKGETFSKLVYFVLLLSGIMMFR